MTDLVWPAGVLPPRAPRYSIRYQTRRGPQSFEGVSQVVASNAAFWVVTFATIPIATAEQVKAWRAMSMGCAGRRNPILLPVISAIAPLPVGATPVVPVPHSDGTYFSDGSGYVGTNNDVVLAGAIVVGATTARVTQSFGGLLEPGQDFSIGERLYRINTVAAVTDSATDYDISFMPPAREAALAGVRMEFDKPVIKARLKTDNAMDDPFDLLRFATPTVEFVEDLT
ncbi:MAG: hypothetical protein AAF468_12620 [Pseudomonadota bacterium]